MTKKLHSIELRVSFGDCDPAGIAFYPNFYSWFDRTFHDWLWTFGGHDALCRRVGAIGMGLMDASARFFRPVKNGDRLTVSLAVEEWQSRALKLSYEVRVGETLMATGRETRGLFVQTENGMIAGTLDQIRELTDSNDA